MIAHVNNCSETHEAPAWHEGFLAILPAIQSRAAYCLQGLRAEKREEVLQEVIANCLVAYRRLAERGQEGLAYPTPLVGYAIAQYFAGRRVGGSVNIKDVYSDKRQSREGFGVKHLGSPEQQQFGWRAILEHDRRTPVPEQAAFRIDFPRWLRELSSRNRRIAVALAKGHRTEEVARRFELSAGRVSQIRRELAEDWQAFHGEQPRPTDEQSTEYFDQSAFDRSLSIYDEALA